jgi:hypothetical protein
MGRVGTPEASFNRFKKMSDALQATGRNILLNLCNWGEDLVHTVRKKPFNVRAKLTVTTVGYVHIKLMAHERRHL